MWRKLPAIYTCAEGRKEFLLLMLLLLPWDSCSLEGLPRMVLLWFGARPQQVNKRRASPQAVAPNSWGPWLFHARIWCLHLPACERSLARAGWAHRHPWTACATRNAKAVGSSEVASRWPAFPGPCQTLSSWLRLARLPMTMENTSIR